MTASERLARIEARIEALAEKLESLEAELRRLAGDLRELNEFRTEHEATNAARAAIARIGERVLAVIATLIVGAASLAVWMGERWAKVIALFSNGK